VRQTSAGSDDRADPYAPIAEFYDLEHDSFTDDLPMYRQIVDMVGDPVLELACGSGRILAALADGERRLIGVDQSETMIDRAEHRFAGMVARPEVIVGDMAELHVPEESCGVVIIGLSSFHHATSQDEQQQVLDCAFRALDPRGMLVLDMLNPFIELTGQGDGVVHRERDLGHQQGSPVYKFSVKRSDSVRQEINQTIWYDMVSPSGAVARRTTEFRLRLVYPSELALLLARSGFVDWQIYGSWELDEFAAESDRMIFMVEKSG
jgi:ubiquinone/menaquinone biosynthesis C-methylase UbiE